MDEERRCRQSMLSSKLRLARSPVFESLPTVKFLRLRAGCLIRIRPMWLQFHRVAGDLWNCLAFSTKLMENKIVLQIPDQSGVAPASVV